jgi:hypothetical protein
MIFPRRGTPELRSFTFCVWDWEYTIFLVLPF